MYCNYFDFNVLYQMEVLEGGVFRVQLSLVVNKISIDVNEQVMLADTSREIASMEFSLGKPLSIGEVGHNVL